LIYIFQKPPERLMMLRVSINDGLSVPIA